VGAGRLFELGVCSWLPTLLQVLPKHSWIGVVFWRGRGQQWLKWSLRLAPYGRQVSVQRVVQVNDTKFATWLQNHRAQAVIVAALGEKVAADTMARSGAQWFNAHPSLLPLYRGGNPYTAVVMDACEETGVTLHEMTSVWDWGPVWAQERVQLDAELETGGSVQLACAKLLPHVISNLLVHLSNQTRPTLWVPEKLPASHHAAWAPSLKEQDRLLDPTQETALTLERRIRALSPWAKGVIAPLHWLGPEWVVIEQADLKANPPYKAAVACADSTTLYVRRCTFWSNNQ
jgi:methionyl-tRNA formyltransferase